MIIPRTTSAIEAYASYVANPHEGTATDFWRSLTNPPVVLDTSELLDLYLGAPQVEDHYALKSSGSSGGQTGYKFGPLFPFWNRTVERWLISSGEFFGRATFVYDHYPFHPSHEHFDSAGRVRWINLRSPRRHELLTTALSNIGENAILIMRPQAILYAARVPELVNAFSTTPNLKAIATTDWDAFYDPSPFVAAGLHINDEMVNWRTGVNFWTCRSGNRHTLPIYVKVENGYHNLLNLACRNVVPFDDHIAISDEVPCPCGLPNRVASFSNHVSQLPVNITVDHGIARGLQSRFLSFQFLEVSGRPEIHYHVEGDLVDDLSTFNAHIMSESCFQVGDRGKMPAFWAGSHRVVRPAASL